MTTLGSECYRYILAKVVFEVLPMRVFSVCMYCLITWKVGFPIVSGKVLASGAWVAVVLSADNVVYRVLFIMSLPVSFVDGGPPIR